MTITRDHPWVGEPQENPLVVGIEADQDPRVLERAREFAEQLRTGMLCVWVDPGHVVASAEMAGAGSIPVGPDQGEADTTEAESALIDHVRHQLEGRQVPWRFVYTAGEVARGLSRVAREYQAPMMVVGSRRPGFAGWMNELIGGSVGGHLAHTQDIPVLVVPLPATRG